MKCLICNSSNVKKILLIHEVSRYTGTPHPLYKCKNCGLIRPDPLPYSDDTKLDIYDVSENIKFYDKKEDKIDTKSYEYIYYFKHFKPFISLVKKYKIKGKALDIGCGAGHLLKMLNKEGLVAEGTEISPRLVKALKKDSLKVYCAELGNKQLKKNNYNLITFNQVLEHIVDPESFLKEVNSLLHSEGYVILAVPYLYGLVPQILRTKWYGLGYGQHVNFFSQESMRILLERNGFKLQEFKILSVDYAHPNFPSFLNVIANLITSVIVSLGLGDNLFVVAKKVKGAKR
ncbi:MAG: methyltransferase domain-containing protein [Nanoarchaeota archaeon]|nr:methyltransferase domain-containing protein [Nanoarchaeota archaeon]